MQRVFNGIVINLFRCHALQAKHRRADQHNDMRLLKAQMNGWVRYVAIRQEKRVLKLRADCFRNHVRLRVRVEFKRVVACLGDSGLALCFSIKLRNCVKEDLPKEQG